MKKRIALLTTLGLMLVAAACTDAADGSQTIIDEERTEPETSATAPASPDQPPEPEEPAGSGPDVSQAGSSGESTSEAGSGQEPAAPTVPAIDVNGFYDEIEGGSNLSVFCPGVGRYGLSYEDSKSLLARIDVSRLIPAAQTYNIEIDSAEPGIIFTAPDFSQELRLDQSTGVAVYEIGGSVRYYYTMPDGFYDEAYQWATTYAQYNFNNYTAQGMLEEDETASASQNPDTQ